MAEENKELMAYDFQHVERELADHVERELADHVERELADHVERELADCVERELADHVETAIAAGENEIIAAGPIEFKILFQDEHMIAIEKPHGFHVHQPELARRRVTPDIVCLPNLRRQIEKYLYPVHRIDVGTEGVLIFALTKEAAANFCFQFQTGVPKKTYFAIVRGYAPDEGVIDIPLELDSTNIPVAACTRFKTHQRVELPVAVGKRHKSARYSLVEAFPETGRFHQVRRHLARLSHPLAGDCVHGDSHHNRFFRTDLSAPGLWLKAMALEINHPKSGQRMRFHSHWSSRWEHVFGKLGFTAPELFPSNGPA